MNNFLINNRFDVLQKIGSGSFGDIYTGIDMKTGEEVAIKMEVCKEKSIQLCNEAKIYRIIAGEIGFPSIKDMFAENGVNTLIIDLLGDSIDYHFQKSGRNFSLKTVLMLVEEMLSRVQFIHSKGIVHNDLKPSNFLTGISNKENIVHLIDFGLAGKFRGFYNNKHIEYADGQKFFGTPEFCSINAHRGVQRSRRDDLESLAYIFIYLMKGSLPWCGLKAEKDKDMTTLIFNCKEHISEQELCSGIPIEFEKFLTMVKKLEFDEDPDYTAYKNMFKSLFISKGFDFDDKFDWTQSQLPKLHNTKILRKRSLASRRPQYFFTSSSSNHCNNKYQKKTTIHRFNIQGLGIATVRSRLHHVNSFKEM